MAILPVGYQVSGADSRSKSGALMSRLVHVMFLARTHFLPHRRAGASGSSELPRNLYGPIRSV